MRPSSYSNRAFSVQKIALSSVSPVQNPVFYPAIDKKIRTEGFNRNKGYFYATWSPKEGLR
jgi:hypothetical protein